MERNFAHPVYGDVTRRIISNVDDISAFKHLIEILSFSAGNSVQYGIIPMMKLTNTIPEGRVDVFRYGKQEIVKIQAISGGATHWEDWNSLGGQNNWWVENNPPFSSEKNIEKPPYVTLQGGKLILDPWSAHSGSVALAGAVDYDLSEAPILVKKVSYSITSNPSGTPVASNPSDLYPGAYAFISLFGTNGEYILIIFEEYPNGVGRGNTYGDPSKADYWNGGEKEGLKKLSAGIKTFDFNSAWGVSFMLEQVAIEVYLDGLSSGGLKCPVTCDYIDFA